MNATALAGRPAIRPTSPSATSPLRQLGQLLVRTAAIGVAASVIVATATAVGYSPIGSELPGPFLPFSQQQHQAAPPTDSDQATRGAQMSASSLSGQTPPASAQFTGRNAPSLQTGLPQELPNLAVFVGLTAASTIGLNLFSSRHRPTRGPAPRTGRAQTSTAQAPR